MKALIKSKLVLILVTIILLAGAIAIPLAGKITHSHAAPSSSQDSWQIVSNPMQNSSGSYLDGTAVVSANDVWAVGTTDGVNGNSTTFTMHWDGSSWTTVPSPNPSSYNRLYSVTAVSSNDVWAVGESGSPIQTFTIHWDGSSWTTVPSPNPSSYSSGLRSVTAVSSNDVWAVGYAEDVNANYQTFTMHWDGSSWTTVPSPNPSSTFNYLSSVTAVSTSDIWAVGYTLNGNYQTLTMRWDGSSWTTITSPSPATYGNNLESVTAVSSNDVWAVGETYDGYTGNHQTLTMHWDGSSWTTVPSPNPSSTINYLRSVTAVSSNDVWAVGYSDINGNHQTFTMHWDGSSWTTVPSPNPSSNSILTSATAVSTNDVWAVGGNDSGSLIEQYAPSTTTIWGVDSSDSITTNFYNQIVTAFGTPGTPGVPDFFGRYIGDQYTSFPLHPPPNHPCDPKGSNQYAYQISPKEVKTAHSLNLAILPIYFAFPQSNVQTFTCGQNYAKAAIEFAQRAPGIAIRQGTAIFVDIECCSGINPDAGFIQGWYDTFNTTFAYTSPYDGKSYTYQAGYYEAGYYANTGQYTNFNAPFCAAVNLEPAIGTNSFIWTDSPTGSVVANPAYFKKANKPAYAPIPVSCTNQQVPIPAAWQYGQSNGNNPNVDVDEALVSLPLWHP